jgi:hypothetical protein
MRVKLAVFFWASVCLAQQYELGGSIGYGVYRNASVIGPDGTVEAGIRNRFAAGAVLTEDLYDHISGELRYLYHDGDPFVSGFGKQANVNGQSHALSYDLLFHARPRTARLRPYGVVGGGFKYFRTTGPEPASQPFPNIVTLTNDDQLRWLVTAGVGVKYRWKRNIIVRADFRDYISPFPHNLFVALNGGTGRGILNQFTPMFGLSYAF